MCDLRWDPCTVWSEKTVHGRKDHRCDSCDRLIIKGELHTSHFHVADGNATSERMCSECTSVREAFAAEHDGMMPVPSRIDEELIGCIESDGEEAEKVWGPMLKQIQERRESAECAKEHERDCGEST